MPERERITQIISYKTEDGIIFENEADAIEHDKEIYRKNKLFKMLYTEFDTQEVTINKVQDWMIREAESIVDILTEYVE